MKPETNQQTEFQKYRADYNMSRESKFIRRRLGLAPQGGSADYHYRSEALYYRDIEKARDMDRNDSIVGQAVTRVVDNTIQDGFTVTPKTGDRHIDAELAERWAEWTSSPENCDHEGEKSWNEIEQHAFRASLVDGDIAGLPLITGRLQLLEGHTIQSLGGNDNVVLGVKLDEHRRRQSYFVMKDPIDGRSGKRGEEQEIPARDSEGNRQVFHIYNPKRISQTRGVTAFAPIFETAGLYEDINFAKLVQQQAVSSFVFLRHRKFLPDGSFGPPSKGRPGQPPIQQGVSSDAPFSSVPQQRLVVNQSKQIGPATEMVVPENEEVTPFSPNVPNSEFFNHLRHMLQLIGVNLGLPLVMMLMDASETNFSGWRGAIEEAKKGFRSNQRMMRDRFHRPVYCWKVRQWMQMDPALRMASRLSGINIHGHEWGLPGWKYIEPLKDAQADSFQIEKGLNSRRALLAERKIDFEKLTETQIEDEAFRIILAKRQAMEINEALRDGQPVHWKDILNMNIDQKLEDPLKLGIDQIGQPASTPAQPAIGVA